MTQFPIHEGHQQVAWRRAQAPNRLLVPRQVGTAALLALACHLNAGCKCSEEHKPYTPFGVASSAELTASPTDERDAQTDRLEPFEPRPATRIDPPSARVEVNGRELQAPDGLLIAQTLSVPSVNGRGSASPPSVLAWLTPARRTPADEPGSLWTMGSGGTLEKVQGFPAFVPNGVECKLSVELAQTGPASFTLDVSATCPAGGIVRAPTRSLDVLSVQGVSPRLLQRLRLADPALGETLTIRVESLDLDGDGRDDVKVTFTMERDGTTRESSASMLWLDRAAGSARDDSEPRKSFADIGSVELVRSQGANTSKHVAERLDNAKRLYSYLCEEGGAPRVTDGDGTPLSCGDLQTAFSFYRLAELRAALTRNDLASALSVLDRADWYGPKPSEKERLELQKELLTRHPLLPTRRTPIRARARAQAPEPRRSPLSFDARGRLMILGPEGISRADENGAIRDVSEEVDPWPLIIFSDSERQPSGLTFPCDASTVGVVARGNDGRLSHALTTEWLSPRPGSCNGSQAFRRPELRTISWSGDELSAVIGAQLFGNNPKPAPGTPLSPDGRFRVHTTSVGLLVVGPDEQRLWRVDGDERECVVANGGDRVACLTDAGPVMLTLASPAKPGARKDSSMVSDEKK